MAGSSLDQKASTHKPVPWLPTASMQWPLAQMPHGQKADLGLQHKSRESFDTFPCEAHDGGDSVTGLSRNQRPATHKATSWLPPLARPGHIARAALYALSGVQTARLSEQPAAAGPLHSLACTRRIELRGFTQACWAPTASPGKDLKAEEE